MKLRKTFLLSSILALGAYTACGTNGVDGEDPSKQTSTDTDKESTDTDKTDDDTDTDTDTDDGTDDDTDTDTDDEDEEIPPAEDNIIENGSFEKWEEVAIISHDKNGDAHTDNTVIMPEKWNGSKSQIYNGKSNAATSPTALFVYNYSDAAHDGTQALQMMRTIKGGQRFTTQAKTIWQGDYKCTAWVRGNGDIRLGAALGANYVYNDAETITSPNEWKLVRHQFSVSQKKVAGFEFILSAANTSGTDNLQVDDIVCTRKAMPCDTKTCEDWQICQDVSATEAKCIAKNGYCEGDADCGVAYKSCQTATHQCLLKSNMCGSDKDCKTAEGEHCDLATNTCYVGNYCDEHTCPYSFQTCDNEAKACKLLGGACFTSADCTSDAQKPVCNVYNHECVGIDSPVNVLTYTAVYEDKSTKTFNIGDFEEYENKAAYINASGEQKYFNDVPAGWFALQGYYGYYIPENQIKPENVSLYTGRVHSGYSALQIKFPGQPAERLTSEAFKVQPNKEYTCTYYVSGKGQYRHRTYCKAWGKDTDYKTVNSSTEWTMESFTIKSNVEDCMIIFYGSNTQADEHLLIDDLSCSLSYQY